MGQLLALSGADVDALLDPLACIAAVEDAFRGDAPPPGVLGMHVAEGGFHVKAAVSSGGRYFAAKINANFPDNPDRHGLPTIQGVLVLFDGIRGSPLAVLDSVRITALRTAAASAVAARLLARTDASRLFIVGCGIQAAAHVHALRAVRPIARVALYDVRPERSAALAAQLAGNGITSVVASSLGEARGCDIVVTCTPAHTAFLGVEHVSPGTFVAAVGADNEHKQEIHPALMKQSRVVVDSRVQCLAMGDTRGAIAAGAMTAAGIHAELADVLTGRRAGRSSEDQVFVFDSTGVGLEDVAAGAAVYERALRSARGTILELTASGDAFRTTNREPGLNRYRFIR